MAERGSRDVSEGSLIIIVKKKGDFFNKRRFLFVVWPFHGKNINLRDQEEKRRGEEAEERRGVRKWARPSLHHLGTTPMLRAGVHLVLYPSPYSVPCSVPYNNLLRETIVNRTYGTHKNLYI